jgi:hypothetical protein
MRRTAPVFVRRPFVFGQLVRLTPLALECGLKSPKMTGRGVVVGPGHTPLSVLVHPEGLRAPSRYAWDFWVPEARKRPVRRARCTPGVQP